MRQGIWVGSKDFMVIREILTFTTIWGISFRSNSNPSGSNRWSSDTVSAQETEAGGLREPVMVSTFILRHLHCCAAKKGDRNGGRRGDTLK
jgi:hypothetical protein